MGSEEAVESADVVTDEDDDILESVVLGETSVVKPNNCRPSRCAPAKNGPGSPPGYWGWPGAAITTCETRSPKPAAKLMRDD